MNLPFIVLCSEAAEVLIGISDPASLTFHESLGRWFYATAALRKRIRWGGTLTHRKEVYIFLMTVEMCQSNIFTNSHFV